MLLFKKKENWHLQIHLNYFNPQLIWHTTTHSFWEFFCVTLLLPPVNLSLLFWTYWFFALTQNPWKVVQTCLFTHHILATLQAENNHLHGFVSGVSGQCHGILWLGKQIFLLLCVPHPNELSTSPQKEITQHNVKQYHGHARNVNTVHSEFVWQK